MAPLQAAPAADDLLFLLSLVNDPNGVIAGRPATPPSQRQPQAQHGANSGRGHSKARGDATAASWQHELASLPGQRRQLLLALPRLAKARHEWNATASVSVKIAREGQDAPDAGRASAGGRWRQKDEADALEGVERAAATLRTCITEYRESMQGYLGALRSFWCEPLAQLDDSDLHQCAELARVGSQLASQLSRQLQWEKRLTQSILTEIDEELYTNSTTGGHENRATNTATEEKLRVWSEALSHTLHIDKALWDFVERETYDDMALCEPREEEGEAPEFLNGEASTQTISVVRPASPAPGPQHQQETRTGGHSFVATFMSSDVSGSLHERIAASASVEEAIDTFMDGDGPGETGREDRNLAPALPHRSRSLTALLLVGEEGCGKTHVLDAMQRRCTSSEAGVTVLRPNYLVDLVGNTVGSSEDRLLALFAYAARCTAAGTRGRRHKCLILLDDLDRLLSLSEDAGGGDAPDSDHCHVGRRRKALLLTALDNWPASEGHVLLLCTARSRCSEVVGRFDRTFRRGLPNEEQRRQLITSCLSTDHAADEGETAENDDSGIKTVLPIIVHHSTGRSAFELSQCCREVLLSCAKSASADEEKRSAIFLHRLRCLDKILQTKSPQSLRGGLLDGIVDMRVYTPEELQSTLATDATGTITMPLLGADAQRAYEALMNVVITPLCRSEEIKDLLYGGGPGTGGGGAGVVDVKPIRVGALLAGAPGTGKTALAYHCAALAANLSRVSLLDVSCTSLVHKEIGGSERAVQRLFAAVRAAAPCLLLLDGIENVARRRGNDNTTEGTMDRILSTFLMEMDGIETGGGDGRAAGNVAVIGVTHNPDLLDPSLLRPGRLEKVITLGAPDFDVRKEIASRQLETVDMEFAAAGYFDAKNKEDVAHRVAMGSAGLSAMEVIAICREASMECLRDLNFEITEKPVLTYDHFKRALSKAK